MRRKERLDVFVLLFIVFSPTFLLRRGVTCCGGAELPIGVKPPWESCRSLAVKQGANQNRQNMLK